MLALIFVFVVVSLSSSDENDSLAQVYCSGALFNPYEKDNMRDIAESLENRNFRTYLPHRDGLEKMLDFVVDKADLFLSMSFRTKFRVIYDRTVCTLQNSCNDEELFSEAAFIVDVFQIYKSRHFVLNMNGRTVDEGGAVEVGIAFALGKKIVLYKDDYRSLIQGQDNSMVVGAMFPLFGDQHIVHKISEIPDKFLELDNEEDDEVKFENLPKRMRHLIRIGELIMEKCELFDVLEKKAEKIDVIHDIIDIVKNKNEYSED